MPMEFEKENEQELGETVHQNELPATLSLEETPIKTGPSSIEELKSASWTNITQNLLNKYYAEKAKKKRAIKLKLAIGILSFVSFPILAFLLQAPFLMNFVGIPTVMLTTAFLISARQKQVMMRLSCIDDVCLVGVLCEMLEMKDLEIQSAARTSLTKILPKLNAKDAELWDKLQRQALRNQLSLKRFANNSAYIEFQLTVLKTYEQIGRVEDKAVIQELANNQTFAYSVREAANTCLPFLDIRIVEERERHQLLRASSFTTLGTDELLRPAKGSQNTDERSLLRPIEVEDEQ